jgi:hypothetical protein
VVAAGPPTGQDQEPLIHGGKIMQAVVDAANQAWVGLRPEMPLTDSEGQAVAQTIATDVAAALIPLLREAWHVDDTDHFVYLGQPLSVDDLAAALDAHLDSRVPGGFTVTARPAPAEVTADGAVWESYGIELRAATRNGEPIVVWDFGDHRVEWPASVAFEIFQAGLAASVHTNPEEAGADA